MKTLKFLAFLAEKQLIRVEDADVLRKDLGKGYQYQFEILDGDYPTPATITEIRNTGFWRLRLGGTVGGFRFWGTADEMIVTLGCFGHIADLSGFEDWLETLPTSERPYITSEAADNSYHEAVEEVEELRTMIDDLRAMLPAPERDYDPRDL